MSNRAGGGGRYDLDDISSSSSSPVDIGSPLPSFDASDIALTTVAPALGVPLADSEPDYLDYDDTGRGVVVTMFANTGLSYLLGIAGGGAYGLREGLATAPSARFKVRLNSILNHCGRHGSRVGNVLGVLSIMYSLYEWQIDSWDVERYAPGPFRPGGGGFGDGAVVPSLAAAATGATYYGRAGPRVAGLAGAIGLGAVGLTYGAYGVLGIPYGHRGYLFF